MILGTRVWWVYAVLLAAVACIANGHPARRQVSKRPVSPLQGGGPQVLWKRARAPQPRNSRVHWNKLQQIDRHLANIRENGPQSKNVRVFQRVFALDEKLRALGGSYGERGGFPIEHAVDARIANTLLRSKHNRELLAQYERALPPGPGRERRVGDMRRLVRETRGDVRGLGPDRGVALHAVERVQLAEAGKVRRTARTLRDFRQGQAISEAKVRDAVAEKVRRQARATKLSQMKMMLDRTPSVEDREVLERTQDAAAGRREEVARGRSAAGRDQHSKSPADSFDNWI